jgi:hypothetical protein
MELYTDRITDSGPARRRWLGVLVLSPVNGRAMSEQQRPKLGLKVVEAPKFGAVVSAPPILTASTHTIDYCCGLCSTVLMHAERDQVHNLLIKCAVCGAYNSTDI